MKVSKLVVGLALSAAVIGSAVARVPGVNIDRQGCRDYGDIVGSMQDIRNKGAAYSVARKDLMNLLNSKDPGSRRLGNDLDELGKFIWSKPIGYLSEREAARIAEQVCIKEYL